jgi:hypothetical protein
MIDPNGLTRALDAYDRRSRSRPRPRRSKTELLAYSAAATGAALMAPEAVMGAIVHRATAQTFTVTNNSVHAPGIDLDGAAGADWSFRFAGYTNFAGFGGTYAWVRGIGTGSEVVQAGNTGFIMPLNAGFSVGDTLASGAWNASAGLNGPSIFRHNATIVPNHSTGYMGVRFQGDTGATGSQYAWLKVRPDFDGTTGQMRFSLLEWAFDDQGNPIRVGDTGAPAGSTPEPETAWLVLLGLGAAGLGAFRRRRQAALDQANGS